jgi:hypothetical protein
MLALSTLAPGVVATDRRPQGGAQHVHRILPLMLGDEAIPYGWGWEKITTAIFLGWQSRLEEGVL